ncbi:MAG: hypothetical protein ACN4GW_15435 [Desulforhopalus sp.]
MTCLTPAAHTVDAGSLETITDSTDYRGGGVAITPAGHRGADLLNPHVTEKMKFNIQGINPGTGSTPFSVKMMEDYGLSATKYTFSLGTEFRSAERTPFRRSNHRVASS